MVAAALEARGVISKCCDFIELALTYAVASLVEKLPVLCLLLEQFLLAGFLICTSLPQSTKLEQLLK